MNYSEKVLKELIVISQTNQCGLFDAATQYCEDHDIDPVEFITALDKNVIERLKVNAVEERMVRRCVHPPIQTLV